MVNEFNDQNCYKLYQTENVYNLLQLNTATGKLKQVQWSLDDKEEMTVIINDSDLSWGASPGTFNPYSTKNINQFILLDQVIDMSNGN